MWFYHGSSAEPFDRFSLDHALEGDGKVKFGWGVYVTEKYSTAAHYAFNKHRPENKDFYVYTVEIPDRTPDNCLSLLKGVPVAESIVNRVEAKLGETIPAEAKVEGIPFRKYLANKLTGEDKPVKKMIDKATVEGELLPNSSAAWAWTSLNGPITGRNPKPRRIWLSLMTETCASYV